MPVPTRTETMLGWAFQTGAINERKSNATFLQDLGFPNSRTVPTETIELSFFDGERKLAPFVSVNAEARSVAARTTRFATVMAPNIRIKRPMDAYNQLLRRQPGTPIHVSGDAVMAAYRQAIADDIGVMDDLITNRVEWMASKMLSLCKIDYSTADPDNETDLFTITFPKNAALGGNTGVALTGNNRWAVSGTQGSTSNPRKDFDDAKFALAKYGIAPTMCVMGRRAAQAFMAHTGVQSLLDNRRFLTGTLTQQSQYTTQGAIALGDYLGVQVWEYSRTYIDDAGAEQYFLDQDTVLFITPEAQANNVMYYGAIPDHDAIEQGLLETRKFSKSWVKPDPSVRIQLAQTRPLPCPRKVNTVYTLVASA